MVIKESGGSPETLSDITEHRQSAIIYNITWLIRLRPTLRDNDVFEDIITWGEAKFHTLHTTGNLEHMVHIHYEEQMDTVS